MCVGSQIGEEILHEDQEGKRRISRRYTSLAILHDSIM